MRWVRDGYAALLIILTVGTLYGWPLIVLGLGLMGDVSYVEPEHPRYAIFQIDGAPRDGDPLSDLRVAMPGDPDANADAGPPSDVPDVDDAPPSEAKPQPGGGSSASSPPTPPSPAPKPPKPKPGDGGTGGGDGGGDGKGSGSGSGDASDDVDEGAGGGRGGRPGRRGRCADPFPGVEPLGNDHWKVDRGIIDYYTSNMQRFNSLGSSRRYNEDGERGWYISSFGCMSPLWKAGLRPRDVVQSVNGRPTNNALQIFSIWTAQRKRAQFEVKVLRRGKSITLFYTVT